jgi:multidrug efflux pump subunit AcrA (membrane-fusion protein)
MGWDRSAQWTGPSMLPQRFHPKLLPGLLIVAAAAWWGLSIVGTGQPVRAQSPVNAKSAAGRVEGGGDVLSLGTSATGTIAELLVHAGAHVQAGQHLVSVECSAIERELEQQFSF